VVNAYLRNDHLGDGTAPTRHRRSERLRIVVATPWVRVVAASQPDGRAAGRYTRAALIGLLGATLIAIAASMPGAPFADKVPGAWFFGTPDVDLNGTVVQANGVLLFVELACGFGGLLLLTRAWLAITKDVIGATGVPPWRLGRILALWSVPLLIAPPMFSDDIYSYAAQGEMVSHHISPYLYGPGVLGATPFESLAQGFWINTPAPYGPLFTGIDGDIVRIAGHRVLLAVVLLRLLAVFGVVLAAIFLPVLARSVGHDPGSAFAVGILNPLILLFLVGSGHNDALMIGLVVTGIAVAKRGNIYSGIILCALAGAVKAPGLLGVAAIVWNDARGEPSAWRRMALLAKGTFLTVTTFEILTLCFGVGWGWLHTLSASAEVTNWLTPSNLLAIVVAHIADAAHVPLSTASVLGPAHLVGLAAGGVVCLWALWRLPVLGLPRALGFTYLAIVLSAPTLQPWYLAWGLVILAVVNSARITSALVFMSIAVCFLGIVGLGLLTSELASLGPVLFLLLATAITAAAIAPVAVSPRCGDTLSVRQGWERQRVWSAKERPRVATQQPTGR
jgi:alpha-1,6-mannosyltransferase